MKKKKAAQKSRNSLKTYQKTIRRLEAENIELQAQVELLELLYMRGTMHQYELVNELRTSKQHVSKMTSRLEQMGYVAKRADNADARGHVVVLSDAGRAYVDRHIAEGSKRARELYSHLSDTERRELDQAMLTVARLLEKA